MESWARQRADLGKASSLPTGPGEQAYRGETDPKPHIPYAGASMPRISVETKRH